METRYSNRLPWPKINDFLMSVGHVRTPKEFIVNSAEKISSLISYDQARIFFLSSSGDVNDVVLLGDKEGWIDAYMEYYSKIENGKYSVTRIADSENGSLSEVNLRIRDWTQSTNDEFTQEYIKPQGIKNSAGFMFHSINNFTRCVYVLDRISRTGFSEQEIAVMNIVQPHLDNFHRNMFVMLSESNTKKINELNGLLSNREKEISRLICEGLSPAQISEKLFICVSTIYRHIANIHTKLHVSTRQELVLKLIRLGISPEV